MKKGLIYHFDRVGLHFPHVFGVLLSIYIYSVDIDTHSYILYVYCVLNMYNMLYIYNHTYIYV
jgi:hypothetical protein